jgi:cellobiose-specific phosphotransferase system component IIC
MAEDMKKVTDAFISVMPYGLFAALLYLMAAGSLPG